MSPTGLKASFRLLQLGAKRSFDECIQMEYSLIDPFVDHGDFDEGNDLSKN